MFIFTFLIRHIKWVGVVVASVIVLIAGFIVYNSFFHSNVSPDAVVIELKSLNRWETTSYTIQKVIDKGNAQNKLTALLFGNRILLVATGEVIGGFDLTTITPNSVAISGKLITVHLPPPQILVSSLDEKKTYVYDRQQGFLVPYDSNLESEARLSAENDIRSAACSDGILQKASDNAKMELTNILKAIGFLSIQILIPKGSC